MEVIELGVEDLREQYAAFEHLAATAAGGYNTAMSCISWTWPDERAALKQEVDRYSHLSVSDRLRAAGRLFRLHHQLMQDPERRARWEAGRRVLEAQTREAFERVVAAAATPPHAYHERHA